MTHVSGPELVVAACLSGVLGAFPTHNAASEAELDAWLERMRAETEGTAPFAANLVVHRSNKRLDSDVAALARHEVRVAITSVGPPAPVVAPLHDAGCLVLADVASMRHVDRAIAAGADGLVLLTAGAGGQTGWANPLSFVRAVRDRFDGPVVLAGGIGDGAGLLAAQAAGADLGYMGTAFLATAESRAPEEYKAAVVSASMDDITLTTALSGLPANILTEWLERARAGQPIAEEYEQRRLLSGPTAWTAGHSAAAVKSVVEVRELVKRIAGEYERAREELRSRMPAAVVGTGE